MRVNEHTRAWMATNEKGERGTQKISLHIFFSSHFRFSLFLCFGNFLHESRLILSSLAVLNQRFTFRIKLISVLVKLGLKVGLTRGNESINLFHDDFNQHKPARSYSTSYMFIHDLFFTFWE